MTTHIKIFGKSFIAFHHSNRFGWLRLFGKGMKWKDTRIHTLLFSERYGYSKAIILGCWRISFLKNI
jgi:hypothetical protein